MVTDSTEFTGRRPEMLDVGLVFVEAPAFGESERERLANFSGLVDEINADMSESTELIRAPLNALINRDQRREYQRRMGGGKDYATQLRDYVANNAFYDVLRERDKAKEADDETASVEDIKQRIKRKFMPSGFGKVISEGVFGASQAASDFYDRRKEKIGRLIDLALPAIQEPGETTANDPDPAEGYGYIKQFMYASRFPEDHDATAHSTMVMFAEQVMVENGKLAEATNAMIEGDYDDLIAHDLMTAVLHAEPDTVPKDLTNMYGQLQLLRQCSDLEDQELLSRAVENRKFMPTAVRLEIDGQINGFMRETETHFRQLDNQLVKYGLSALTAQQASEAPHDTDFGRLLMSLSDEDRGLAEAVLDDRARAIDLQRTPGLTEAMAQAATDEEPATVEAVKEKEPRKIYFRDEESLNPSDDKDIEAKLGKELGKLVQIDGFMADLSASLDQLSRVDFSTGNVRGISKYPNLRYPDRVIEGVYGFKPADSGIALRTKAGKKLRMLCTFESEDTEVHVRVIRARDEMNKYLRNHGIGSQRSRGHQK